MAKGDSWAGYFSGGGLLTHLGWLRGLGVGDQVRQFLCLIKWFNYNFNLFIFVCFFVFLLNYLLFCSIFIINNKVK